MLILSNLNYLFYNLKDIFVQATFKSVPLNGAYTQYFMLATSTVSAQTLPKLARALKANGIQFKRSCVPTKRNASFKHS